jgi:hypothetical protein
MFAESIESAVPRIGQGIAGQKTIITIFFTSTRLLVLEALPKCMKFNQGCCVQAVLPGLSSEKRRISREKGLSTCQFTGIIQCVTMVTKSERNLTTEALNELHTHRILQI